MKGLLLLMWALFIDGLQAGISFALAGLMGTIGGAVGAALWCNANLPGWQLVQNTCVAVGGAAGTFANPILMPFGIALGFVINICLSLTMGAALLFAIHIVFGRQSPWLWGSFLGDMMPGINNVPFWTFMVLRAWYENATRAGGLGFFNAVATIALVPTRGIMNMKEQTMDYANKTGAIRPERQERAARPQTIKELEAAARTRTPMQDIRPKTT